MSDGAAIKPPARKLGTNPIASDLRPAVREALDHFLANGFDPRTARDAKFLAEDFCVRHPDFEDVEPETIIPFVREWLVDHR